MNYKDEETPYTRILEHKFFDNQNQKVTYISEEYPAEYDGNNEPYYPIRDQENVDIYQKYKDLSESNEKYIFGGRLATYAYYDMHQIVAQSLKTLEKILWAESIQN